MVRPIFNMSQEQLEEDQRGATERRAVERLFLIAERAIASRVGDSFRGAKITQVGDRGFHAKLTGQVLATFFPWNGDEV